eukprot:scaffold14107_cov124-Isochrysis_galbana.AAC.3
MKRVHLQRAAALPVLRQTRLHHLHLIISRCISPRRMPSMVAMSWSCRASVRSRSRRSQIIRDTYGGLSPCIRPSRAVRARADEEGA